MKVSVTDPEVPLPSTTGGEEDGDRFSNLPVDVISNIFSFCDAIDVIRTSAVARKWRYLWVSMTCVNFDISNRAWSNQPELLPSPVDYGRYRDMVNRVLALLSQDGPAAIQISSLFYQNHQNDYTVERWIDVLSRKNVKEISLAVGVVHSPVELPHCLVTCESLVSLRLDFRLPGVLNLPTFAGFSQLKSLILVYIEFLDSVSLGNFISSCPCLENLYMLECIFRDFKILDIRGSRLKRLCIGCGLDRDEYGLKNCEVKVGCPSLEFIRFSIKESPPDFTFQETNCLKKAIIYLHNPSDEHASVEKYRNVLSKIIKGVCNVEFLRQTMPLYRFLIVPEAKPEQFSTSLNNLKTLRMYVGRNKWYMKSMLNLLNSSPILETLTVTLYTCGRGIDQWTISDKAISCLTDHLKIVEIHKFDNIDNELRLVRFLLKHGKMLQKMSITWKADVVKSEEIMQQIKELAASYSGVIVTFH